MVPIAKFFDQFKIREYPELDLQRNGCGHDEILRKWEQHKERSELVYEMNMKAISRRSKAMNYLIVVLVLAAFIPDLILLWKRL